MRYCNACGQPINDDTHAYVPLSALEVKLINERAPHPSIARSRVRGASRRCKLVDLPREDGQRDTAPQRWAAERRVEDVEAIAA
jgi:hypothetical protein